MNFQTKYAIILSEVIVMSNSICNFMPAKKNAGNIKTVHFVYEADFHTLKQPFLRPIYYVNLVTSGSGTMKIYNHTYQLTRGTLFFLFPAVPCSIEADGDFKYLYISFMGSYARTLLEELNVSLSSPVFSEFGHMIDFWMSSITHVNSKNANILSEGVLLCTLSYLTNNVFEEQKNRPEHRFDMLLDYVNTNYRDPDLSLKKIAGIFYYTEKYISHLFKKKMNIGFNQYLNDLRIQYAYELFATGVQSVSEIAVLCGYSDPLYFSKVFKKSAGLSPTEYMKQKNVTTYGYLP